MGRVSTRLLAMAPGTGGRMAGLVGLLLAVTATHVGQGVLIARVLAAVFAGDPPASVLAELGGIVALQLARAWLLAIRDARALEVSGAVKEVVRDALTAKLLQLGPGSLQRARTGSVQSAMVDGVELLDPLVGRFLPQAVASALGALAVAAYVFVLDPLVGAVVLACALAAPAVVWGSERLMDARASAWTASYRALYAENLDALQGMATLKAFNASRTPGCQAGPAGPGLLPRLRAPHGGLVRVLGRGRAGIAVGTMVSVALAALHRAEGSLSNAELFTILILARECIRPFHDFQSAYHASYQALPASKGIFELLDRPPEVAQRTAAAGDRPLADPPRAAVLRGRLHLRGAGPPGAGRVLPRGRSGRAGRPGRPLRCRQDPRWCRCCWGSSSSSGAGSWSGARPAPADPGGAALAGRGGGPGHLPVPRLGPRQPAAGPARRRPGRAGGGGSGGQGARVHRCPARRLRHGGRGAGPEAVGGRAPAGGHRPGPAQGRPILVLDEPTSNLDAASEREVAAAMTRARQGRTTLVIAHRLSTIRAADRIVVLEAGRVAEVGTHGDLAARGGAYTRLLASQLDPGITRSG